ncbi:hypothetical protein AGDE_10958 [Angomonas deanei]|nr:hypothetical protein AGDE_10958 [Angomonas deanei]|eukprot:EPY27054.1 hypothetical protein AGDE_10958 [Angomonas deanei]
MFTLMCCADVDGEKVNLEITLDDAPHSVSFLEYSVARVFTLEAGRPVQAACLYIYDDASLLWTKLENVGQLCEYDQLYLFQPQTTTHADAQQDLPPPRPPRHSRAAAAVEENMRRRLSSSTAPPLAVEDGPRALTAPGAPSQVPRRDSNVASHRTSDSKVDLVARLERLKREKEMILAQKGPS